MDPNNAEAFMEVERLTQLLQRLPAEGNQPEGNQPELGPPFAEALNISDAGGPDAEQRLAHVWSDVELDVIVIGAGAAGIGCAFTLSHIFGLDPSRVLILERGEAVGA